MTGLRLTQYLKYLAKNGWTVKEVRESFEYVIAEKNFSDFTLADLISLRKNLYNYSDVQYMCKNKGRCEVDFVKVMHKNKTYFWDMRKGNIPPMLEIVKPDRIVIYDSEEGFKKWNITKQGRCPFKNVSEEKFNVMTQKEKQEFFDIKFISFAEFKNNHPDLAKTLSPFFDEYISRKLNEVKEEKPEDILLKKLRIAGLHPEEKTEGININFNKYRIGKKIFVDVSHRNKNDVNKLIQEVLSDYKKII